jgi:hypothetical protein
VSSHCLPPHSYCMPFLFADAPVCAARGKGRPYLLLSSSEEANLIGMLETRPQGSLTVAEAIVLRKLKLQRVTCLAVCIFPRHVVPELFLSFFFQHMRAHNLPRPLLRPKNPAALVALPPAPGSRTPVPPDPEVLRALHDIRTTPFRSSFLSRLNGFVDRRSTVVAADWEARSPWMDLMEDVRAHHALKLYVMVPWFSMIHEC